jgi:hypothetical protein
VMAMRTDALDILLHGKSPLGAENCAGLVFNY